MFLHILRIFQLFALIRKKTVENLKNGFWLPYVLSVDFLFLKLVFIILILQQVF